MAKYELLDDLLSENDIDDKIEDVGDDLGKIADDLGDVEDDLGDVETGDISESIELEEAEYQKLDDMTNLTFKKVLKTSLLSFSESAEDALHEIGGIYEQTYTDNKVLGFLDNSITPVLELCDVYDQERHEVDLVIYETALGISLFKQGRYEELEELTTIQSGKFIEEQESALDEPLHSYINLIFAEWGIDDIDAQSKIIEEAESIIDADLNYVPVLGEAASLSIVYEMMTQESVVDLSECEYVRTIVAGSSGVLTGSSISSKWNNISETTNPLVSNSEIQETTDMFSDLVIAYGDKIMNEVLVSVTGGQVARQLAASAAVWTAIIYAFSKARTACHKLKGKLPQLDCHLHLVNSSIPKFRSALAKCKDEKCKAKVNKQISKLNIDKEKLEMRIQKEKSKNKS